MSPGGLPSGGTTTKTVKIDSKKPDKPEIFVSEEGMLTIEAKDATSGIDEIRYQITGKPESEYTGEVKLTGNGEVTIAAIATDNAGNVSEAATFKAEIYTEKPAAPELVGVSNDWVVSEEPVIVTIVQGTGSNKPAASSTTTTTGTNEISIRYQVNGDSSAEGGWQLYKEGAEIPFDEEGTYRISAFTEDEHGNKSEVVTGNVKIDYTAPSMRGIATSRFDSSIDRTSFRLYFEDDVSGVDKIFVGIDGQEKRLDITAKHRSQGYATMTLQMPPVNSDQVVASTDTGSLDEEVVVPGAHVVFFRALDKAGNESKIEMISDYPGNPATASQDTIDKTNPFTGK
jgi:hypothetical protein